MSKKSKVNTIEKMLKYDEGDASSAKKAVDLDFPSEKNIINGLLGSVSEIANDSSITYLNRKTRYDEIQTDSGIKGKEELADDTASKMPRSAYAARVESLCSLISRTEEILSETVARQSRIRRVLEEVLDSYKPPFDMAEIDRNINFFKRFVVGDASVKESDCADGYDTLVGLVRKVLGDGQMFTIVDISKGIYINESTDLKIEYTVPEVMGIFTLDVVIRQHSGSMDRYPGRYTQDAPYPTQMCVRYASPLCVISGGETIAIGWTLDELAEDYKNRVDLKLIRKSFTEPKKRVIHDNWLLQPTDEGNLNHLLSKNTITMYETTNVDRYSVRTSILKNFKQMLPKHAVEMDTEMRALYSAISE